MEKEIKHFGVLGMRWGRRRGSSGSTSSVGSSQKRSFKVESLSKNMDGRKVNKLFGKRNRTAAGKAIVNGLMTPSWSKKKYTEMNSKEKKKVLLFTAAVATLGATLVVLK